MKIIFVRHGHPNYVDDCLTELGNQQASLTAERLKTVEIHQFYASSCGRAYETACHIAEKHHAEVEKLDFMRELSWGKPDTEDFVHPWILADEWVKAGKDVMNPAWCEDADYAERTTLKEYNTVVAKVDEWLCGLGFKREGMYYRVTKENRNTVLLVSHGGSSSAVLSHIFNLPFTFVCRAICPGFTAITEVSFDGVVGELTSPKFELVNDANHVKALELENFYGN